MLKTTNTGTHAIVWTQETLHTPVGMGSAALAAAGTVAQVKLIRNSSKG